MEKYEVNSYDISENLKNEVKSDIKGEKEKEVEAIVMGDLSDLKSELWFEQKMVDILYRKEYKDFLKSEQRNWNSLSHQQLKSIKESIILRDMTTNKSLYSSPSKLMRVMYNVTSVDQDLTKNSKMQNIIKWVIDELLSFPEMMISICKDLSGFWHSFVLFFKNNLRKYVKHIEYELVNFPMINLSVFEWQYNFWKLIGTTLKTVVASWARTITSALQSWITEGLWK